MMLCLWLRLPLQQRMQRQVSRARWLRQWLSPSSLCLSQTLLALFHKINCARFLLLDCIFVFSLLVIVIVRYRYICFSKHMTYVILPPEAEGEVSEMPVKDVEPEKPGLGAEAAAEPSEKEKPGMEAEPSEGGMDVEGEESETEKMGLEAAAEAEDPEPGAKKKKDAKSKRKPRATAAAKAKPAAAKAKAPPLKRATGKKRLDPTGCQSLTASLLSSAKKAPKL